jgi:CBS domain-containing protein
VALRARSARFRRTNASPSGAPLAAIDAMPTVDTDAVPITAIMTRATITARPDASVESLVALMTHHHIGCVPIVDEADRPKGIVTKLDLIECGGDGRVTAREVMMPNAMTLPADATLAGAASLMSNESVHHVLVVDSERTLMGVVSTFDITRWLALQ